MAVRMAPASEVVSFFAAPEYAVEGELWLPGAVAGV
jgi:hypothetical protein